MRFTMHMIGLLIMLGLISFSASIHAGRFSEQEALNASAAAPQCGGGQCRLAAQIFWVGAVPIEGYEGMVYYSSPYEAFEDYNAALRENDGGSLQEVCTAEGSSYIGYSKRKEGPPPYHSYTINGVAHGHYAATCSSGGNDLRGFFTSAMGFCPIGYSFVPGYDMRNGAIDIMPNPELGACVKK